MTSSSHGWRPSSNPRRSQIYSVLLQRNWRVETMGSGITRLCDGDVTGSCRTGEVEGMGTVELVCVGRLLRMGGKSLLLPVWRSVGGEFIGKGGLDSLVVRAVTWRPGNLHGMGTGWAVMGGNSTRSGCPVHLVDGYGWMSGRGGQRKLFSVVTGKRNMSKVSPGLG